MFDEILQESTPIRSGVGTSAAAQQIETYLAEEATIPLTTGTRTKATFHCLRGLHAGIYLPQAPAQTVRDYSVQHLMFLMRRGTIFPVKKLSNFCS